MGREPFIFRDAIDAFSYFFILLCTGFFPAIISMIKDEPTFFMLTIFLSVIQTLREYLLLIHIKPKSIRYWIERKLGLFSSAIVCAYSVIMLLLLLTKTISTTSKYYIVFNIIAVVLFFIPLLISLIEGIIFNVKEINEIKNNDKTSIINEFSTKV